MKKSYLKVTQVAQKSKDTMDKFMCLICREDVRESTINCEGPRHDLWNTVWKHKNIEIPTYEAQKQKHGLYVNPQTGRIERISKTLNTQTTLGKE